MRFLIITNHFLDSNNGGSFASRAYINAFAELADKCLLLYPCNGANIEQYINKGVILKGIKNEKNKLSKLIDIYLGRINRYSETLLRDVSSFDPDIVVFDNSRSSAGLIKQVKSLGKKVITIHHNYEMQYYDGTKPPLLWRFPFMYFMRKAECAAVLYSDINLTLTNQDAELLQKNYDREKEADFKCVGVFECKRTEQSGFPNSELKTGSNLCFAITGSLNSYQTEVSLIPFLEEYFPVLLEAFPESELIIAGKNPSIAIKRLCQRYSHVELIANPPEMPEIMKQADIYICPVAVGGGLKLRVMDGLKMGLPVLSHIISARGYDDFIETGFLLTYNDKTSFKNGLLKVGAFFKEGEIDSKRIKLLYKQTFSFEAGISRLKRALSTIV